MTRCEMPPGPDAVECEAWAVAQTMVSGLPFTCVMWSILALSWGMWRTLMRMGAP